MKENNWTKWSSIAEIISSAAILITLVYLAIQTEQNTAALLSNGRQDLLETELEYLRAYLEYPEIAYDSAAIVIPEINDGFDLDVKIRKTAHSLTVMRMREAGWDQLKAGVIDQEIWNGYMRAFIYSINNDPYFYAAWNRYKITFNADFVAAVETDERLQ